MRLALASVSFCAALLAQAPKPPLPVKPAVPVKPAPAAVDPNTIVLKAGDFTLTAAQFNEIVKGLDPAVQQFVATTGRRAFAQKIVELHFLAREALRKGLDKDPDLQLQLRFQTDKLMEQAMFRKLQEITPVPEAEIEAYYAQHKTEFEVITARHILVRVKGSPVAGRAGAPELSDEQAKARAESIRKRLVAGEDFAKVAKEDSDDLTSAVKGGDLGSIPRNKMVAQFEQAAFAQKPGDISEPVRTSYGYHIIQVQTHVTKPFAEVRSKIVEQLKPAEARKASKALVEAQKAELNESFFTPPQPK